MRTYGPLVVVFALVLSAFTGGCAFGDRHVELSYAHPKNVQWPKSKGKVTVLTFADARERDRKQDIGEVRNGFGAVTADIKYKGREPGRWVADSLAEELKAAGLEVVRCDAPEQAAPGSTVISGTVTKLWVNMYMTYDSKIRTTVRVQRGTSTLLDQEVKGDAEAMAVVGSTGEYRSILEKTLQDWMKNAVPVVLARM